MISLIAVGDNVVTVLDGGGKLGLRIRNRGGDGGTKEWLLTTYGSSTARYALSDPSEGSLSISETLPDLVTDIRRRGSAGDEGKSNRLDAVAGAAETGLCCGHGSRGVRVAEESIVSYAKTARYNGWMYVVSILLTASPVAARVETILKRSMLH
jgi:hypothetical protein